MFTKITIGVAAVWILLCLGATAYLKTGSRVTGASGGAGNTNQQAPADPGGTENPAPAEKE